MTASTDTHAERVGLILDGARGVVDRGEIEVLVRGMGQEVRAIWVRGGAYCDDGEIGRKAFTSMAERAVDNGGEVRVGDETWPSRYLGGWSR